MWTMLVVEPVALKVWLVDSGASCATERKNYVFNP